MIQKKIGLRELQMIELDILSVVDAICNKQKLTYYLAYGTLLGAVRHKGFIPWDDDVDILMPRPDYENLIKHLREGALPTGYSVFSINDLHYIYPYMKVVRTDTQVTEKKLEAPYDASPVWIDIFPMDGIPESLWKQKRMYFISRFLRNLLYIAIVSTDKLTGLEKIGTAVLKPFMQLIGPHRISTWIDNHARKVRFESTPYMGNVVWAEGSFETLEKEVFTPSMPLIFEGREFTAPQCYDQHLQEQYGKYWELPPEDKRVSHLDSECYILF